MHSAVVALALLESVSAFQAPAVASRSLSKVQMFSEGDIGVLPPLGVYDPLGLIETRDMGRYEIMEIKHGRAAMLGFLHVISVEAGAKIPIPDCEAAPTGLIASLEAVPTVGWLQIMLVRAPSMRRGPSLASRPSLPDCCCARPATPGSPRGRHCCTDELLLRAEDPVAGEAHWAVFGAPAGQVEITPLNSRPK